MRETNFIIHSLESYPVGRRSAIHIFNNRARLVLLVYLWYPRYHCFFLGGGEDLLECVTVYNVTKI